MPKSNRYDTDGALSGRDLILVAVISVVAGFFVAFAVIAYTPMHNLVPGYPSPEVVYRQMQEAMRLDSLERSVYRWEIYSENLRRVVNGETPMQIDSMIRRASVDAGEMTGIELTAADSALRAYVAEEEMLEMPDKNKQAFKIEGLHFFKPLSGSVVRHYETAQHPYIDITAPEGSPVKAVLDGIVLFTSWNEADNWSMVIQHQDGMISIYKHNQKLLKNVADKVEAGATIALLGTSAAINMDENHLHFELWQYGEPLDPTVYISF